MSLQVFLDVAAKAGRDAGSTADVSAAIVKPMTAATAAQPARSGVEVLKDDNDKNGKPLVGEATVFVSHAWKLPFADIVAQLSLYEARHPGTYFWFDLFTNNQHTAVSLPQDWWATTFKEAIRKIGAVVLMFTPWEKPTITTRCWCLWEIFCGIETGATIEIELPAVDDASLREAIMNDIDSVMQNLCDIEAEKVRH